MTAAVDSTTNKPVSLQRVVRYAVAGTAIFVAAALLFLWAIGVFGGNIHAVVKSRVYRSAQLTGSNLENVLSTDHIGTVINLRGGTLRDSWYVSEVNICRERGIKHDDVAMTAYHLPTPAKLNAVLYDFDHATYPVLFHCKSGSDRSGLVGAIYLAVYQHEPVHQAEASQLTWRYGHFSFGESRAMDDFFKLYDQTSSGMGLREWIVRRYPQIYEGTLHSMHRM